MYQVTRLPNGLTIATAEMPHMASVSLGLWVGMGGRYESASLNGVSHFIEHMLFKGTARRSARKISEEVEGLGGYLNAFTSEESSCFYAKAPGDKYPAVLDVLMDMYLCSEFAPAEIDKERNVIKEEIAMYLDQPSQHVQELLNETLWPDQPLGRPLTGTEATLDRLQREQLVGFHRAKYVAANTFIAAAGNLKHVQLVSLVSKYARHFRTNQRPVFSPVTNAQQRPRIRLATRKTEQTQMALGIRTCSRHDERRYALRILNTLLGENMSSRLFQVVREDHGLAYSIYSQPSHFDDTGDLVISAGLDTDKLRKTLKLVLHELCRFTESLPTTAELRRAREYLLGQLDLNLEGTENQMMWIGEQLVTYGKINPAAEVKRRLRSITASQVRAAARDFFRPAQFNLALVSPLKSDSGLSRLLAL